MVVRDGNNGAHVMGGIERGDSNAVDVTIVATKVEATATLCLVVRMVRVMGVMVELVLEVALVGIL